MRTLRRLLILFILSVIVVVAFYFIMDDVVVSSWSTKLGEIITSVISVFVFITIAYYAIQLLKTLFSKGSKTVQGIAKKSPPKKEGQNL
jgi:hypothetical protein